ncbi:MAG: zinc-binding alcohol dehydrogenase family protein [Myxococcales bacterium]|nr:zinc-binding alcohol dehydrogenase family protein [Myxococcales bacterium]MCB9736677.1 zinc-binding alcohol dehydrogenase family protein [Deltaproteobacteria bacterium]
MRAAVVHTFGEPPRYQDHAEPTPGPGEVVAEVRAAALHNLTRGVAAGRHYSAAGGPPLIPGVDGVGVLSDGRRVMFGGLPHPWGTMAERVAVRPEATWPVPDGLDDTTAAALFNAGMGPWMALALRARLARGERVAILGATGVTGQLAVQIAKELGAGHVVAVGRNEAVLDTLEALGADEVVAFTEPDETLVASLRAAFEGGVDVVVDMLWGKPAEAAIRAIVGRPYAAEAPRVRFVQMGEMAGPTVSLPAGALRSSGLEILGSGLGSVAMRRIVTEVAPPMFAAAARGALRIAVRAVPLADVESAWDAPQGGVRTVFVP